MKDFQAYIEKLRKDAAEAALIRDLATDPVKREMFDRLGRHLNRLADEVEQAMSSFPSFTFAPGTETKQISGFNCKKVVATDTKDKKTYDIWVTNDITVPPTAIAEYYKGAGGFPVQYTAFQQGQSTEITVSSVTDQKAPAGTFGIPADFDKISKDDLAAMSGGR